MAVSPQKRPANALANNVVSPRIGSSGPVQPRQFSLTGRQIVFLWFVSALALGLTFLFGLYAGRRQGVAIALEERGAAMVRLPIAVGSVAIGDSATAESAKLGERPRSPSSQSGVGSLIDPKVTDGEATKPAYDFASAQVQRLDDSKVDSEIRKPQAGVVGFAGRSAESVQRGTGKVEASTPPIDSEEVARLTPPLSGEGRGSGTSLSKKATPEEREGLTRKLNSESKPAVKTISPGKWSVQVAAPRSRAEAETVISRLKRSGLAGRIEAVRIKNITYYRVIIPAGSSRAAAETLKKRISGLRIVNDTPLVRSAE